MTALWRLLTQPLDGVTGAVVVVVMAVLVGLGMDAFIWYRSLGQSRLVQHRKDKDITVGIDQIREARMASLKLDQETPSERLARLHAPKVSYDAPTVGHFGQKGKAS